MGRSTIVGMTASPADVDLVERLRAAEVESRQSYARTLDLVAELESSGFVDRSGYPSTARLLADLLHLSTGEARRRVEEAGRLCERRGLTGEVLPPLLSTTAEAARAGLLGMGQLRVVLATMDRLPPRVDAAQREQVEKTLAAHAVELGPAELGRVAQRVLDHLDPDGPAPAEPPLLHRELRLYDRPEGRLGLAGELDPEGAAALRAVLNSLRQPPAEGQPAGMGRAGRDADALVEACHRLLGQGELPETGGERPHVTVLVRLEDLEHRARALFLDYHVPLAPETARRICCDAKILLVVLGGNSEPLDIGRITYSVPAGMRRALVARDQGCAFPECERPPSSCEAHHIRHWADGGETKITNLVLLCGRHHRLLHRSEWAVHMSNDKPEFVAPEWLAPLRK